MTYESYFLKTVKIQIRIQIPIQIWNQDWKQGQISPVGNFQVTLSVMKLNISWFDLQKTVNFIILVIQMMNWGTLGYILIICSHSPKRKMHSCDIRIEFYCCVHYLHVPFRAACIPCWLNTPNGAPVILNWFDLINNTTYIFIEYVNSFPKNLNACVYLFYSMYW